MAEMAVAARAVQRIGLLTCAFALVAVCAWTAPVSADAVCRDGTTSSGLGEGTCSQHGGVDYWLSTRNPDGTRERIYTEDPDETDPFWLYVGGLAVAFACYVAVDKLRTRR
jgi:hypothetical protein